ncbi:hypothetical protein ACFX10_042546 [Malus domestica]
MELLVLFFHFLALSPTPPPWIPLTTPTDSSENDQTAWQPLRYTILKQADMSQRQLRDITEVCSTLFVSRAAAIILLRRCDWNASKLFD